MRLENFPQLLTVVRIDGWQKPGQQRRKIVKNWYKDHRLSNLGPFSGGESFIVQQPLRVLPFYRQWCSHPLSVPGENINLFPLTSALHPLTEPFVCCPWPALPTIISTHSAPALELFHMIVLKWIIISGSSGFFFLKSFLRLSTRALILKSLILLEWVKWPCHVGFPSHPVFPVSHSTFEGNG